ncbi:MAG: hypothetical protein ACRDO1_07125 [Nocardioidaceae bacterium]
MGWVGPTAKKAAKLGVKYGPHAAAAWKVGGAHLQDAAQTAKDNYAARRAAIQHAETVVDGTVLKTVYQGTKIWVVFAGDRPLTSYPQAAQSLEGLVADADLGKRLTPQQIREQAVAARAKRAARSVPAKARRLTPGRRPDRDELPPG